MMRFEARARGCLFPPPPWKGRLGGLHSRALSILHPEGFLVSLVAGEEAMEALALGLDWEDFEGLRGPCAAALEAGRLEISASDSSLAFAGAEIGFGGAAIWDSGPRIEALRAALAAGRAEGLGEELGLLLRLLEAGAPAEGILGAGPFGKAFRARAEGPGYPTSLLGFGPGTTPAGDDFVAGLLLAEALFGAGRAASAKFELSRTTSAGRSLLSQALSGRFPELHTRFAESLLGLRPLRGSALALLGHGASSGSDFLAGFLRGAEEAGIRSGKATAARI